LIELEKLLEFEDKNVNTPAPRTKEFMIKAENEKKEEEMKKQSVE